MLVFGYDLPAVEFEVLDFHGFEIDEAVGFKEVLPAEVEEVLAVRLGQARSRKDGDFALGAPMEHEHDDVGVHEEGKGVMEVLE